MAEQLTQKSATYAELLLALKSGHPCIFPTDTVYGLGLSVAHAKDLQAIYSLKKRCANKPIAWLISKDMCDDFVTSVPNYARALMDKFWPGALTLVLCANDSVPKNFLPEKNTLALRCPKSDLVLQLIKDIESPLATTSANISGNAPTSFCADLDFELYSSVACAYFDDMQIRKAKCEELSARKTIADTTAAETETAIATTAVTATAKETATATYNIASTVCSCTKDVPVILREGSITKQDIENAIGFSL